MNKITPIAVSIPDAGRMVGLSRSRIYELMDEGTIESRKVGRRRLVLVRSLERLFEAA